MEQNKIKVQVHLVETDEDNPTRVSMTRMPQKGKLVAHIAGGEFRRYLQMGYKPQHLYFTTDEEIKEGDWYLSNQAPRFCVEVRKGHKYPYGHRNKKGEMIYDFHTWKTKIVATTNPELWLADRVVNGRAISEYLHTPKIDTPFIEAYIKAYNEGNPIKEVLLEIATSYTENELHKVEVHYKHQLKLKPNGSVIIHPVKKRMFTEEEMFRAYSEGCRVASPFGNQGLSRSEERNWQEWFSKSFPE